MKEYSDFIFRFEFRLESGGNNGVAIRAPLGGRTSRRGIEIQILDDTSDRYKNLKPYQFHGSVYGLVPAKRGHLNPVGEWNCEEIAYQGTHIRVTLNGTVIVDADLSKIDKPMDGYDHPGRFRKSGFVGFMGHRSRIELRNIRIKDLAAGRSEVAVIATRRSGHDPSSTGENSEPFDACFYEKGKGGNMSEWLRALGALIGAVV